MPEGSTFRGYEDDVVQELILQPHTTRYRRERWQTPDGQTLRAPWPDDVLPGSHFGPTLYSYILHQHHHPRVTQPLVL